MNVTWEVRREVTTGWLTVYDCSGTDFVACFNSALNVMKRWQKLYPNVEWELVNEKNRPRTTL